MGSKAFKKPHVEQLAIRWQDRCLQIRLAAQELLVAELKNLGVKGRKHLVDQWGAYLPKYGDPPFQNSTAINNGHQPNASNSENSSIHEDDLDDDLDEDADDLDDDVMKLRRNQSTAVILLGKFNTVSNLTPLEPFEPSRTILGPLGPFMALWDLLGPFGIVWDPLEALGTVLNPLVPFLVPCELLGPLLPLWALRPL